MMQIIAFLLLFLMGFIIIFMLMLGGKQVHSPKLEELNLNEDFPIYYSNNNSLFPGLGVMAYFLLWAGMIAISSTYGRGLGR